jgi:predicted DNA-binding transcriptional regulator YafY
MPQNKFALRRYQIIDDCFHKKPKKQWTHAELMGEIKAELGLGKFSLRSIQLDLDYMKSNDGYNAPIKTKREGMDHFHYYSDPDFTIRGKELSEREKKVLQDVVSLLEQFKDLPHFEAMQDILLKIENWNEQDTQQQYVLFEENEYVGRNWIKPIYEAVQAKTVLRLQYKPFAEKVVFRTLHPYFLKEYRNRWYVFGYDEEHKEIRSAALDRIEDCVEMPSTMFKKHKTNQSPSALFKHIIGVTLIEAPLEIVRFRVHQSSANYLKTKKLHHSQQVESEEGEWTIFSLKVKINYELKAELYRLGAAVEILYPTSLRAEFRANFLKLNRQYED